jgi:hypothetical protein
MPITYRYDGSLNVLFVEMHGVITDEEILQYAKTATTDTEIPSLYHELIDLRGVEVPEASTDTLRRVATTFQEAERGPTGVKVAFVASSDAAFGMARMYQAFRADSKTELNVFREMGEARSWLGLPPEPDARAG